MSEIELYRFAEWVAKEVCQDDFDENAEAFAEIACRKLHYLGFVEKDGACWSYEPPKELVGTDMRGGIRRDDAGNVIDWGITGPPGDVGKTEEE